MNGYRKVPNDSASKRKNWYTATLENEKDPGKFPTIKLIRGKNWYTMALGNEKGFREIPKDSVNRMGKLVYSDIRKWEMVPENPQRFRP